ncbi:hypothetical protein N7451_004255 [Penicillium sp. IBT 35674x]|nr:hypothetical protein N7451_004255 [Penicillium sp. IBT 35674x]
MSSGHHSDAMGAGNWAQWVEAPDKQHTTHIRHRSVIVQVVYLQGVLGDLGQPSVLTQNIEHPCRSSTIDLFCMTI